MLKDIQKIAITGSKGKTTITLMISAFLLAHKKQVLRVDTTGSYLQNDQLSTLDDSLQIFGKAPNVMPGRYLYWHLSRSFDYKKHPYAVLETGIGSAKYGIGCTPDVMVFSNVFREHLGHNRHTRKDIYSTKADVIRHVKSDGVLIANLDDTCTKHIFTDVQKSHRIFIGYTKQHMNAKDIAQLKDQYRLDEIVYISHDGNVSDSKKILFPISEYAYYAEGADIPMIENLLATTAVLMHEGYAPQEICSFFSTFVIPPVYGRNQHYSKGKKLVVLDYAHEPTSLRLAIDTLVKQTDKNVTIVTRGHHVKSDEELTMLGNALAKFTHVHKIILFDTVEGERFETYHGRTYTRKRGEIPQLLQSIIQKNSNTSVVCIQNEMKALQKAIHNDGQPVLHIVHKVAPLLTLLEKEGFKQA